MNTTGLDCTVFKLPAAKESERETLSSLFSLSTRGGHVQVQNVCLT
jgi:hypothetical protein